MGRKKTEVPENIQADIRKDLLAGRCSLRSAADKYGYSLSIIRRIASSQAIAKEKVEANRTSDKSKTGKKAGKMKKAVKNAIQKVEIEHARSIVNKEHVDIFEGMRVILKKLERLFEEFETALPDIQKKILEIVDFNGKGLTPLKHPKLFNALLDLRGFAMNYFGKKKLNLMAFKEFREYLNAYAKLQSEASFIQYYDKMYNDLFDAINAADEPNYMKIRERAIANNRDLEEFFRQNEAV